MGDPIASKTRPISAGPTSISGFVPCAHTASPKRIPSVVSIGQSTDGLVMVLLGGVDTLTGPIVGAAAFTWLRDELARETDFWRACLGLVILAIVLVFPQGLAGGLKALYARCRPSWKAPA